MRACRSRTGRAQHAAATLACLVALTLDSGLACAADATPPTGEAATPPTEPAAPPAAPSNKLTLAYYAFSSGNEAADINLRHSFESSTGWVGAYRDREGFDQARTGWEYDLRRDWFTFVPSVQAATHGFLGGSVYGEVGKGVYAIMGLGRTNLQPYWNLGFDPNDYAQYGVGYRDQAGNTASVFAIRDNRLGTGQTNTHVFLRRYLPDDWRLTLDVVRKRGYGDGGLAVNTWSASVGADWRRWFLRMAVDPYVNYTPERQVRVAGGLRF